jgi:hypothetical protein
LFLTDALGSTDEGQIKATTLSGDCTSLRVMLWGSFKPILPPQGLEDDYFIVIARLLIFKTTVLDLGRGKWVSKKIK